MKISTLGFSLVEKFAIVQAVDAVIVADGTIHQGEINALSQLMRRIDFETNFILQARNMSLDQGRAVLREMSYQKKQEIASILEEIALSDGFIHETESKLIASIFEYIGVRQGAVAAK
ncbi:TerB family tellurite resistance protein [Aurantibacter crassamenti]|uniref:TerB family tellurite resistance protein n=1 Tax=Aurantibacter crassamenti TaxID=1837375 RepID=UPI00193ADC3C|nr:TerB family tellurite resistance protein [Aurantibacter crassamenti]MBM1105553.1 TerB family tellurite resistance protein [Aurantibacter crassamenti]